MDLIDSIKSNQIIFDTKRGKYGICMYTTESDMRVIFEDEDTYVLKEDIVLVDQIAVLRLMRKYSEYQQNGIIDLEY